MVQALILAAGRGSRMKTLTDQIPKCLVKIGGKTLLNWQIEGLKKAGIQKITLATGYLEHELRKTDYSCISNPDWSQTNMVATLCCASQILLEEETIVSYSDIAFNSTVITSLLRAGSPIAITYDKLWGKLWSLRFHDPLVDAESFQISHGVVKEIGKKPAALGKIEGQFMGLLKFTPEGWKETYQFICSLGPDKTMKMQMTELLQYLIESSILVEAIPISGKWCEVDSPEDLAIYDEQLKNKKEWEHDWRH